MGMQRKAETKNRYELFSGSKLFQFIHSPGRIWPLPPPNKCYGFPDQVRAYYQNAGFLSDLELAFEEQLRRVYYLDRYELILNGPTHGRAHSPPIWVKRANRPCTLSCHPGTEEKPYPLGEEKNESPSSSTLRSG